MKLIPIKNGKKIRTKNAKKLDMAELRTKDDFDSVYELIDKASMKLADFENARNEKKNRESQDNLTLDINSIELDQIGDFYEMDDKLYFCKKSGDLFELDFKVS